MANSKVKIFRYADTQYPKMWEKEAQIIEDIRASHLDQALQIYRCSENTLVLPSGRKWQATQDVVTALSDDGWSVLSRRSGGAPVPQTAGMLNVSHFYLWPEDSAYSVKQAYERLCHALTLFFESLEINVQPHATAHSFCDGDYNLNVDGQKIVGTAQRVLTVRKNRRLVLAQACILMSGDMQNVVKPVNLINRLHGYNQDIRGSAHTTIAQHVASLPDINTLYSGLVQAFVTANSPS